MTNLFAMLLMALSAVAMAAPGVFEKAHAVADRSIPTTCVTGVPASTSGYDIDYAAAVVDTAGGNRFYDIEPAFNADPSVGSAMVSRSSPRPFL